MLHEDAILNSPVVYSEEDVLAEFQAACEAEAESPGHYTERVKFATQDLCQMLVRKNSAVQAKKNDSHVLSLTKQKGVTVSGEAQGRGMLWVAKPATERGGVRSSPQLLLTLCLGAALL